ncbi:MAG: hypothetical protein PVI23_05810 [Maricaulaceae bacterium]|jgi:hypothetical protein
MNSILPADDQPRHRVAAKVFADVPSQAELAGLRRNRNQLAVWVVLLLGMLIASVVALALSLGAFGGQIGEQGDEVAELTAQLRELDQERADVIALTTLDSAPAVGRLDEAIAAWAREQTEQIAELEGDIADLEELREYQAIHDRRVRAAELRADIAQLLELPARRAVPDRIDLSTYEEEFPPWKEDLEARLLAYVNGLEAERQAILDWEPLRPGELDDRPDEPRLP